MYSGSIEYFIKNTGVIAYNTKTKKIKTLVSVGITNLFYYDGYIYGRSIRTNGHGSFSVYKINIKTGKYKKIITDVDSFDRFDSIYAGRLYYISVDEKTENKTLYSCDVNGKNKIKFDEYEKWMSIDCIADGRLYYNKSTGDKIMYYSVKLNGKGKKSITEKTAENKKEASGKYIHISNDSVVELKMNSEKNSVGYMWLYGDKEYVAFQNNKLYYTYKSKLYCENVKTGKKKVLTKVPGNTINGGHYTTVAGCIGKYLVLEEVKLVKQTARKQIWKRTVWLYTTSGEKVKTLYSQKSTC
jgi:hypothetical protein